MLSKQYRLPAKQKLRNTSFYKTQNFSLRIASNELENNRFGFIVRKTIDKRAVVRNRIRRVFRSCIEEMHDGLKTGYDMLFLLEKGIIGKDRSNLFEEIKKLLAEKGLLKESKNKNSNL